MLLERFVTVDLLLNQAGKVYNISEIYNKYNNVNINGQRS